MSNITEQLRHDACRLAEGGRLEWRLMGQAADRIDALTARLAAAERELNELRRVIRDNLGPHWQGVIDAALERKP